MIEKREKTLAGHHSLTKTIAVMHRAFIVIQGKSDTEKKDFFKKFKEYFEKDVAKAWNSLMGQAKKFEEVGHDVVCPLTLFQHYDVPAYIGEKEEGVLFCKGMVIGLKLKLGDYANMSYRLDFDLEKRLHINFEVFGYKDKSKYPICVMLNFSSGRFGFAQKDKQDCLQDEDKMLALLECTKTKFWLKMTMGKTLADMQRVNHVHQQDDGLLPKDQLLAFIQGDARYHFATVKDYVCDLMPVDKGQARIRGCQTEQALLQCMNERPIIRSEARYDIFVRITEKDPDHRLLKGLEHMKTVALADSDQRIDSEQPPTLVK